MIDGTAVEGLRPDSTRFDGQFEILTLEEILALVRGVEQQRAARAAAGRAGTGAPAVFKPLR